MIEKNLAYSTEQLHGFFKKMDGVVFIEEQSYRYGAVHISFCAIDAPTGQFGIKRSMLYLDGPQDEIDAFYYQFLIHHMTMGG